METTIKVLIVENDYLLAKQYKRYLASDKYEITDIARNAGDALKLFLLNEPDIILLDIVLDDEVDGIELAKKIRKLSDIPFLYITGHEQSKNRAWETLPVSFIMKPVSKEQLNTSIEFALFLQRNKRNEQKALLKDRLFIKGNESMERVDFDKILYIQASSGCSLIYIDDNKSICYTKNIQVLEQKIRYKYLVRVHRSYIVNLDKVESLNNKNNTLLVKGVEIPIGKTYLKIVKKFFDDENNL